MKSKGFLEAVFGIVEGELKFFWGKGDNGLRSGEFSFSLMGCDTILNIWIDKLGILQEYA